MGRPGSRRAVNLLALNCRALLLALLLSGAAQAGEQLLVLSQNMNRLFDDVDDGNNEKRLSRERFRQRVTAAAEKFGGRYGLPQIIALQEIENLNVLNRIAAAIETGYATRYRAILLPGNDLSGINVGFLVHPDIEVRRVEQLFRERRFGAEGEPLFSRPPLALEACLVEKCLTLLNLHLRSMRGIDDSRRGPRVRRKRLRQAETVAAWSDRLQKSNPPTSFMMLGDFNALTPADEFVDVAGILRGNPRSQGTALRGRDLIEPDLVDLTASIPASKRYSFLYRKQKQQLDYMLVNRDFDGELEAIGFSRIDYGFSDHAGLLARFSW